MAPDAAAVHLRVGVVGVGRAGSVLGAALARAGHRVVAANAVSDAALRRAAELLPTARLVDVEAVVESADLVLLTVPDDALPRVVAGLARTGVDVTGRFVLHASGRYGVQVLDPLTERGALPLALHPAMTLTGTPTDLQRLAGAPFGITAPDPLRPVAELLVVEMGGEPVWVPEQARAIYHAALANGANHLVTLVTMSVDLLASAGVEAPARLLTPLLTAALDNALRLGDSALTGPVVRGDAGTVGAHLAAMGDAAPAVRQAYVAMARLTADRALAAGMLSPQAAEALLDVLAAPPGPTGPPAPPDPPVPPDPDIPGRPS